MTSWIPFNYVNKLWDYIVRDFMVIDTHMDRVTHTFVYQSPSDENSEKKFTVLKHWRQMSLNSRNSIKTYRLKNSTSTQRVIWSEVCYIPTTNDLKLIDMHYSKEEGNRYVLGYNILRVDADFRHKHLVSPSSCNFKHVWLRTINIDSVFYILKLGLKGVSDIDCVDLENEHVISVNVPQNFFSEWANVHPVNWDGKLALAGIEKGRLGVWVLENYRKRKWVKNKVVIPLTFMKDYPIMLSQNMVPYAAKDNRVCWFHVDGESRDGFSFDIESKKVEFKTCSIILGIHLG